MWSLNISFSEHGFSVGFSGVKRWCLNSNFKYCLTVTVKSNSLSIRVGDFWEHARCHCEHNISLNGHLFRTICVLPFVWLISAYGYQLVLYLPVQTGAPALLSNPGQKAEDIAYFWQAIEMQIAQNGEQVAMSPVALCWFNKAKRWGKTALLCFSFLIVLNALCNRQLMSIMALFSHLKDQGCMY